MLTAKVYHEVKSDIQYTQDLTATYIKAKNMILEYLEINGSINNETIRELCRCTKKQANSYIQKMRKENILGVIGKSRATRYIKNK